MWHLEKSPRPTTSGRFPRKYLWEDCLGGMVNTFRVHRIKIYCFRWVILLYPLLPLRRDEKSMEGKIWVWEKSFKVTFSIEIVPSIFHPFNVLLRYLFFLFFFFTPIWGSISLIFSTNPNVMEALSEKHVFSHIIFTMRKLARAKFLLYVSSWGGRNCNLSLQKLN